MSVRSAFHRALREKVEEAYSERQKSLSDGAALDYAAYKEQVGYLRGLADVLTLADEIENEGR